MTNNNKLTADAVRKLISKSCWTPEPHPAYADWLGKEAMHLYDFYHDGYWLYDLKYGNAQIMLKRAAELDLLQTLREITIDVG